MIIRNKILKINRHLFYKWDLHTKQGIAEQSPKGFDSPFRFGRKALMSPACHADNKKTRNRAEMFKLNFSLQDKGYRLIKFVKLNLFSLTFSVFRLFNLKLIIL